jgi:hypothetical protein
MKQSQTDRISFFTFLILSFVILILRLLLSRFETHDLLAILSWDVSGYYLYLPATFIYHDPGLKDLSWLKHILDTYKPVIGFYQAYLTPAGDHIFKYPMGLAILYSPFFFLGHFFSWIFGFARDGFSLPYQVFIAMGGLIYTILSIGILRKVLLRYFRDGIVALTMVLVVLGSNYFQFTGAMPHNYLFTLYALIVWITILWHEMPKRKYAISLGLAIGLAILVLPASAVIILVPLLWGIVDKETLQRKWSLIRSNWSQVILCVLFLVAVAILQMLYRKIQSGSFFYNSNEPDEKLRWIAPYLWQVLFSFKKGWFIFSPVMVFPLLGFYFLAARKKDLFYATFLFFLVNVAVVATWPAWLSDGSLDHRALMESSVILAIPFGYLLQWMVSLKPVARTPFYLVFLFLILLNLFQTWQYLNYMINPSKMTKDSYWAIFGRTKVPEDPKQLIEGYEISPGSIFNDAGKFNIRVLHNYDFENKDFPYPGNLVTDIVKNGHYAFRMDTGMRFSPGLRSSYADLSEKLQVGIRVTAWVYSKVPFPDNPGSLVVTSNHEGLNYRYETISLESGNLMPEQWNKVGMYYLTPESPDPEDVIQIYVWFRGKNELYIDDLKIELFEPKE